jgi:hypothetical protein
MSKKIKALDTITSHKNAKHRRIAGIIKVQINSDVEWQDRTEKPCYNEVYYKKIWFLGIPIWDRRYAVFHRNVDGAGAPKKLGFSK